MIKRPGLIILFTLLFSLVILLPAGKAFASYPGSYIMNGNCNPDATPEMDAANKALVPPAPSYELSCVSQGITPNNFAVQVYYNSNLLDLFGASGTSSYITVGNDSWLNSETDFTVDMENGDMACVNAHPAGILSWTVSKSQQLFNELYPSTNANTMSASGSTQQSSTNNLPTTASLPDNCIYMPAPTPTLLPPKWGGLMSPVCFNYTAGVSALSTAGTQVQPFTSIIVQCVEDTMLNLFFYKNGDINTTAVNASGQSLAVVSNFITNGSKNTIFGNIQAALKSSVLGLLALYIIFIGYHLMLEKKIPGKPDWFMHIMKIALVLFFATGPGLTIILPSLINASQSLSAVVMNSDIGSSLDANNAKNAKNADQNQYDIDNNQLISDRINLSTDPTDATLQTKVNADNAKLATDTENLNAAEAVASSYGYNYCNFTTANYNYTNPVTGAVQNESNIMLFDILDCKMQKYLGMGYNTSNTELPQTVLVAAVCLMVPGAGIIIFIFILIYVVYIILTILRITHIYIMAMVALILLVFVGPIFIPAALFERTKAIYDRWFSNICAYTVQPILLFVFVAFMLGAADTIYYGGNNLFDNDNNIRLTSGACQDNTALACILQTLQILKTPNIGLGEDFAFYYLNLSPAQSFNIIIALMKMALILIILHTVMGTVENMTYTLTNAAGGGAAGLSRVPAPSPMAIGSFAGSAGIKAQIFAAKSMGIAARAVGQAGSTFAASFKKRGGGPQDKGPDK